MKVIYQTRATASAGRDGQVATDDGMIQLKLDLPKEMGGKGEAANPEQLFAAGYSACFSSAVLHVARGMKVDLKQAPVTAEIGLGSSDDGKFGLSAAISVQLDIPQDAALKIVRAAHQICPYSLAISNSIAVAVSVNGESI